MMLTLDPMLRDLMIWELMVCSATWFWFKWFLPVLVESSDAPVVLLSFCESFFRLVFSVRIELLPIMSLLVFFELLLVRWLMSDLSNCWGMVTAWELLERPGFGDWFSSMSRFWASMFELWRIGCLNELTIYGLVSECPLCSTWIS